VRDIDFAQTINNGSTWARVEDAREASPQLGARFEVVDGDYERKRKVGHAVPAVRIRNVETRRLATISKFMFLMTHVRAPIEEVQEEAG